MSSEEERERPHHIVEPLELPEDIPAGFDLAFDDPIFDPRRHLQVEPPSGVFTAEFERRDFPYAAPAGGATAFSLGYTDPFRLLSDEGVRAMNAIVAKNEVHAKSNERIPKCLRGLGYRSRFVRSLTYHPEVVKLMSRLAGKPLGPHGMPMNIAHTNFGKKIVQESGAAPVIVDQWHVDSVDYVCVLILSDLSKTVGGELEVLHKLGVRDNADFMRTGVTPSMQSDVRSVAYPGPGYCILMQGSAILHRVSPVFAADVPRISVVTSYMSLDVFDHDSTRYHTFAHQDPEHVAPVEFARHQAWRVRGVMDYIVQNARFGRSSPQELAGMLRKAATTLERSSRLLSGEEDDVLKWIDHETVQSNHEKPQSKL